MNYYVLLFYQQTGEALVKFKLNTTATGKLYFYLGDKWPQVEQTSQCQTKLDQAQYSCKFLVNAPAIKTSFIEMVTSQDSAHRLFNS